MEAIQQLLNTTGLSADDLIRQLAEFKKLTEKSQCKDANKNGSVASEGVEKCNEEKAECANVTSTSDALLNNESNNNKSVDSIDAGDGECVSTTALLCNNEEVESKGDEWVVDVEDDRLSLNMKTNHTQIAVPEGITGDEVEEEEETLISDKSKSVTEGCESNHPKTSVADDTIKHKDIIVNTCENTPSNINLSHTETLILEDCAENKTVNVDSDKTLITCVNIKECELHEPSNEVFNSNQESNLSDKILTSQIDSNKNNRLGGGILISNINEVEKTGDDSNENSSCISAINEKPPIESVSSNLINNSQVDSAENSCFRNNTSTSTMFDLHSAKHNYLGDKPPNSTYNYEVDSKGRNCLEDLNLSEMDSTENSEIDSAEGNRLGSNSDSSERNCLRDNMFISTNISEVDSTGRNCLGDETFNSKNISEVHSVGKNCLGDKKFNSTNITELESISTNISDKNNLGENEFNLTKINTAERNSLTSTTNICEIVSVERNRSGESSNSTNICEVDSAERNCLQDDTFNSTNIYEVNSAEGNCSNDETSHSEEKNCLGSVNANNLGFNSTDTFEVDSAKIKEVRDETLMSDVNNSFERKDKENPVLINEDSSSNRLMSLSHEKGVVEVCTLSNKEKPVTIETCLSDRTSNFSGDMELSFTEELQLDDFEDENVQQTWTDVEDSKNPHPKPIADVITIEDSNDSVSTATEEFSLDDRISMMNVLRRASIDSDYEVKSSCSEVFDEKDFMKEDKAELFHLLKFSMSASSKVLCEGENSDQLNVENEEEKDINEGLKFSRGGKELNEDGGEEGCISENLIIDEGKNCIKEEENINEKEEECTVEEGNINGGVITDEDEKCINEEDNINGGLLIAVKEKCINEAEITDEECINEAEDINIGLISREECIGKKENIKDGLMIDVKDLVIAGEERNVNESLKIGGRIKQSNKLHFSVTSNVLIEPPKKSEENEDIEEPPEVLQKSHEKFEGNEVLEKSGINAESNGAIEISRKDELRTHKRVNHKSFKTNENEVTSTIDSLYLNLGNNSGFETTNFKKREETSQDFINSALETTSSASLLKKNPAEVINGSKKLSRDSSKKIISKFLNECPVGINKMDNTNIAKNCDGSIGGIESLKDNLQVNKNREVSRNEENYNLNEEINNINFNIETNEVNLNQETNEDKFNQETNKANLNKKSCNDNRGETTQANEESEDLFGETGNDNLLNKVLEKTKEDIICITKNEDLLYKTKKENIVYGTTNEDVFYENRNEDGFYETKNKNVILENGNEDVLHETRNDDALFKIRKEVFFRISNETDQSETEDNLIKTVNENNPHQSRNMNNSEERGGEFDPQEKDKEGDLPMGDDERIKLSIAKIKEENVPLNKSVLKNITVMKEIVDRICKSQDEAEARTKSAREEKARQNFESLPSSSTAGISNSEVVDDVDLTMMDDEDSINSPEDLDYEESSPIKDDLSFGDEDPSISGPSSHLQSPENSNTYTINSPTTHKPITGCIRKRKENVETTTPIKKLCIDESDAKEEQTEEPSNMRHMIFNQLQQLRQGKINESPLIDISHPIPKIYKKRVDCKNTELKNEHPSCLGIQIVEVRGGVTVNEMSPIKLTKTQDITKIKGWRRKNLLVDENLSVSNDEKAEIKKDDHSGEGCSYSTNDAVKKKEGLNVFTSNNLEGFLTQQKSLNISYNVPNLESSNHKIDYLDSTVLVHEPVEKCTDKKRQYVLAENEDCNTLKQNCKTDASKPRTLAEKRKLLNNKVDVEPETMILSSVYYRGARYLVPTKYNKPIYIGKRSTNKKKYKLVEIDRRYKPSILKKDTPEEKPKVSYKPGPLCKKEFLQNSCQEDWDSILVKLPRLKVEIKPEFMKPVHPTVRHFTKFETFEISEDRMDFALSALIGTTNEKKFSFDVDYERNQEEILMRKRVVKKEIIIDNEVKQGEPVEEENMNLVIATMMDDLISCVENSEIQNTVIKEDPDFTPYVEDTKIPSKYKEKKVKTHIIKGKARRTNLELKRLNVKVIEVNIEDEHTPTVDCKKAYCKLGCVCHSLDKTTLPSDHCGNFQCIFKCKCAKRKNTLKFVLPSGTDILSECTVNKLQNEAKKDLAKVEKEFTQTVIHANNQTILFGDSKDRKRRSLKQPKKYQDYIETSVFSDDIIEDVLTAPLPATKKIMPQMKPCFVKLEKINLEHVIPYCWAHNIYDCDCGCTTLVPDEEEENSKLKIETNKVADNINSEHGKNDKWKEEENKSTTTSENESEFAEKNSSKERLKKKHKHCARTMGISTMYYLERNRTFTFKKMIAKKIITQASPVSNSSMLSNWLEQSVYQDRLPNDIFSIDEVVQVKEKPDESANNKSNRRKQVLITREEVFSNEQNKKKQEEDMFNNYPEVYKPSEVITEKFNQLLRSEKSEPNDYRLLQWSTMMQRYLTKIWDIWTAPTDHKIRFIITKNKVTELNGFINIRSIEEQTNPDNVKIDFIRWILQRSSPGGKSPENTLLILKKSGGLWEVCGMCTKNLKNQKLDIVGNVFSETQMITYSCNFYLKKNLVEITTTGEHKDLMSAALPNTQDNTKWKILKINSTFSILEFTQNGSRIKCSELINLIKQAQKGLNTLVVSNISKGYKHKLFGIYIVHNHTDKVFIGPYYSQESHGLQTLRFLYNKLVTTEEYSQATGVKVNTSLSSDVWHKQLHDSSNSKTGQNVIDLIDKEEIIIHVVDDNEEAEENNAVYEIVQNTPEKPESSSKQNREEKVDPLIIKISKRKSDAEKSPDQNKRLKKGTSVEITPIKNKRSDSDTESPKDEDSKQSVKKRKEEHCVTRIDTMQSNSVIPNSIVNTSPRSLLKTSESQKKRVSNSKKTVVSIEIRYFQLLKKLMIAQGNKLQSYSYPIAFKVNFSKDIIHGYRMIDHEKCAVFKPGSLEPIFFKNYKTAEECLQRILRKMLIPIPAVYPIQVRLIEYPEYLNMLSRPVQSMQGTFFNEVCMVGEFGVVSVNDFDQALVHLASLESFQALLVINESKEFSKFQEKCRELDKWMQDNLKEMQKNLMDALKFIFMRSSRFATNTLKHVFNKLSRISRSSTTVSTSAQIFRDRISRYLPRQPGQPIIENKIPEEVICLDDSDEEGSTSFHSKSQECYDSISTTRPELTITPVTESDSANTSQSENVNLSDTTIIPIINRNEGFHKAALALKEKGLKKLCVTLQKGQMLSKPKTVKLLMMPIEKRVETPIEKIDLSSFTTSTISSMLGANLTSKQITLTIDQLNQLKELSKKSRLLIKPPE